MLHSVPSLPTFQTVFKASKILPTMLMGFIIRGERYGKVDCGIAIALASGASLFFLSNSLKTSSIGLLLLDVANDVVKSRSVV